MDDGFFAYSINYIRNSGVRSVPDNFFLFYVTFSQNNKVYNFEYSFIYELGIVFYNVAYSQHISANPRRDLRQLRKRQLNAALSTRGHP